MPKSLNLEGVLIKIKKMKTDERQNPLTWRVPSLETGNIPPYDPPPPPLPPYPSYLSHKTYQKYVNTLPSRPTNSPSFFFFFPPTPPPHIWMHPCMYTSIHGTAYVYREHIL